jgi:pimeloyl-ACP methyl ester carboxylesterase
MKAQLVLVPIVLTGLLTGLTFADNTKKKSANTSTSSQSTQGRTIVLVHGAFADASSWSKVIPLLSAKGYNVIAVHLPMTSVGDDVAAVKRVIDAQPGDVTLVGHSYGGRIITEAGNNAKVKSLVYVAAFAPDKDESITSIGKGSPPPDWQSSLKVDGGDYAWLPPETVKKDFAQDLPEAEQKVIAATQGPLPKKSFDAKLTGDPAWRSRPSFYIQTENDRMIDPKEQAKMAKRANAKVTQVKASHVVMLSQPDKVAQVIITASSQPVASR